MRQTFDSKTPLIEQRIRVAGAKQPGRKHNHKPSSRVTEKRKAGARRRSAQEAALFDRLKAAIRAYWLGEVDSFPTKGRRC